MVIFSLRSLRLSASVVKDVVFASFACFVVKMKYRFNRIMWLSAAWVGLLCMSYTPAQEPPSTNAFPNTGTGGVFNVTFTQPGEYDILVTYPSGQTRRLYLLATNRDSDNDGMPDWWEFQYFGGTSPAWTDDYDADGLNNSDEYLNGTDPTTLDTDGDGAYDGREVNAGFDPVSSNSLPVNISGAVTYGGRQPGAIYVVAVTASNDWAANYSATLSDAYAILNAPGLADLWVRAFSDMNTNGLSDPFEAYGEYVLNPVNATHPERGQSCE